jgi:aerobic carbon-monoxide dehydrogenase medium subunit
MQAFDHHTPETLLEALSLLERLDGRARLIAGGTDLLLKMQAGAVTPPVLINIKRLPELKGIAFDENEGLRLGALTTVRELARAGAIRSHYPVIGQAAGLMASEQVRSLATLGGNLCNAAPSADLAPPLIALDATAEVVGPAGTRTLPLAEFFLGPGQTVLQTGELLQAIRLPPPRGRAVYLRHTPRAAMDIAVVAAAVRLSFEGDLCREVRLVLGAVAPIPLRVRQAEAELTGRPLTPDSIEGAAAVAAAGCAPIDDIRASAAYRRRIVAVLVRRGLLSLMAEVNP